MASSRSLRRQVRLPLAAAFALTAAAAFAASVPLPPAPQRWVTDAAGFLSDSTRRALDARLEAYERQTGHQVLVWIGRSTGDRPIEDFALAAFKEWRVGRKGLDDGLVIFVLAEDRKIRFEVGYGLEDRVPDVTAIRIIRDVMAPRIQAGDRDGALQTGVEAALSAIEGRPVGAGPTAPGRARGPDRVASRPLSLGQKVVVGILVLAFLLLLVTNPSFALWLLFSILSGGRGGGGGGGGGGFSGGGGRSGGGGATGSW